MTLAPVHHLSARAVEFAPASPPVFAITEDTLAAFISWQRARGLAPRTIEHRVETLRRLATFSTARVEEFLGVQTISTNTRASYFACIRAYAKWLMVTEQVDRDPLVRLSAPRRRRSSPRPVEDAQLLAMLDSITHRRTRAFVYLAALAGLRIHEIAKVRGDDIDLWARTITVRGKGGAVKTIPLHPRLVELSREWPRSAWWFPTHPGQMTATSTPHISRHAVGDAIRGAMRRAGVPGTPHALRHWYGTTLLQSGVDLRIVQELMRHDSILSTQIYTRVSRDQLEQGIAALHMPSADSTPRPGGDPA